VTTVLDLDEDRLKQFLADELDRVRRRSLALTRDVLDEDELTRQHSSLMSPLVWDLAHVGNYEELWLLRAAAGHEGIRPEIDTLYDAFEHPRSVRPTLPLLNVRESVDYIDLVRRRVLDDLDRARLSDGGPLLDQGFVQAMVVQHEHQHDETMLATHQLRRGAVVLPEVEPPPTPAVSLPREVLVPAGEFVMGTSTDPWAYDNERPAHVVGVPAFFVDVLPVTNAAYAAFVDDGGYDRREWWSAAGWDWRCRSGKRTPAFWVPDGAGWARRRFGLLEPLPPAEPVQHVCHHEAEAYAAWCGRRLPTEPEWEKVATWDPVTASKRRFPWGDEPPTPEHANLGQRHYRPSPVGSFPAGASAYGVQQLLGDVWEWTSTDFRGHPGFCQFPYPEYSEVFFGPQHMVLRGGSWATDPMVCRGTFRSWDLPIRRQIFAGFRTARSA
jgi:iron(II)-dependent oxidoreductase